MSLRDSARQGDGRRWEFSQEGDEVGGIVTGVGVFEGDYDPAPMLTIDAEYIVEGGEEQTPETIRLLCGSTVLKNKVEELNVEVGDEIAIFFGGEKQSKGGNDYKAFNVQTKKPNLRAAAAQAGGDADW